ncbi:guanine nucleotide-binding protein subunit beta-like protein 1 [Parasteatoda tepidariorum]|uniref:guanine nucleotide-binding protein subunit beta-like protein 1 n=1 Tax=Parasteatoda tepidariorum TaxID=114398 RepID=UPI00077FB87E|nr:guanine nucleotide-binding protein subunit beta-like protein 1 [Parasteatoda tepidariorum]
MPKLPPLPFFILHGHEGNITALEFNNETDDTIDIKPTLLSGSDAGEIFIWNLQSFRTLFKFISPMKKPIMFLKYYKSKLFIQSKDGVINVWSYDNFNWTVIRNFESDSVAFCASVFWLSDNKAFITLYNQDEHLLDIYNLEEERKSKQLKMDASKGLCMCLKVIKLHGKQFFLAGFENGAIELRDGEDGNEVHSMNFHEGLVTCLDYDLELKNRGISGGADKFLQTWSISDNFQIENVCQLALTEPGVSDVKIRHDGKIVIAAGWDFSIKIFSWKTLKPLAILNFHEQTIHSLACSPFPIDKKNSVFASGSKDKNIALWTIY